MADVFLLDPEARITFLRNIVHSLGCTYICLWSYLPELQPSSGLFFMDGYYNEASKQPSTSSAVPLSRTLFTKYSRSLFFVENGRVPGLAFKNNIPYVEFNESELHGLATAQTQLQFYQEAKIKTVTFMGCKSGEIELGTSNANQMNMELEMRKWFPEIFHTAINELPRPTDQNLHSSSSSSLRSLSVESPEYSSLLFNTIPSTSYIPTPEGDDAAMTQAILAVLSSAPSQIPQRNLLRRKASAFKNYTLALRPSIHDQRKQSMFKRVMAFYKSITETRSQEQIQGNRPSTVHHMISERKRRVKINESFDALKQLLPPGSKRDKVSVLINTRDYLNSLKAQVSELKEKNRLLEAQLLPSKEVIEGLRDDSFNGRFNIKVSDVSVSTSDERFVDLQVSIRGDCSILDLMIRVLEFLKVHDAKLLSMETNTHTMESSSMHLIVMRLKIEGTEWDEPAFREAVRRIVADIVK